MIERFVIVGGGQSAAQAATTLRESGFDGTLIVVGEEPELPYQRPPLSKKFLLGEQSADRIELRTGAFYRDLDIEVRTGVGAQRIDRDARRVHLMDGDSLPYDKLLLATGGRPRTLALPGADLAGLHSLRTKADAERLRADMVAGRRLVVIGGGYVGMEIAAAGIALGLHVMVLESAPRVLGRGVGGRVAEHLTDLHRRRGVDVRCCAAIERIEGSRSVSAVRCDGESMPADLVVIGIGITPCDELARDAGLSCDDGIVVDLRCRTSDPTIFAAGDCTNHPNPLAGRRLRLECVHNAVEQAKCAALNMLGKDCDHAIAPWFWSDQYETKWRGVGLSAGHDSTVLRGDPIEGRFSLFYMTRGVLTAVDAVNSPRDFLACRRLIPLRPKLSAKHLADPAIPLLEVA